MHKIIWDKEYIKKSILFLPQVTELKKIGRINGMKVISIVKTNIDRDGFRYRFRMPWESIEADCTFTDTEQDAMEKLEALLNQHKIQMYNRLHIGYSANINLNHSSK
jgi:hypothetical protein